MKKITAVLKKPGEECIVTDIDDTYRFISSYIDGLIDITPFPKDENIDMIFNDEFLINGMLPNIKVPEYKSIYNGPLIFAGNDKEKGESRSLNKKQIELIKSYCKSNKIDNYFDYMEAYLELTKKE